MNKSIFSRSLASSALFVMLATLSGNARAEPETLSSFNYSDGSSEDTDLGEFGAGYSFDFSVTVDKDVGSLEGDAHGDAYITLLGETLTVVEASVSASGNTGSSDGLEVSLTIAGYDVDNLPSFSTGITYELDEDEDDGDTGYCTEFFDVSSSVVIVVVPVTMTVGATGCATLSFSADPSYNASEQKLSIDMNVTPGLNASMTASVGVGTSVASAGIEAEVTLLNVAIPVTLLPSYDFNAGSNPFSINTTGQLELSSLDGSVSLYAKVDLGLWDVKYTYELFDWDGLSYNAYIWSTGQPSATNVSVSILGGKATATYTYADTANTSEGSSDIRWHWKSSATAASKTYITLTSGNNGTSSYSLDDSDDSHYLVACVTPKNGNGTYGTEKCSDTGVSVGKLATYYQHGSYTGSSVSIAYENSSSNTCFNLDDYLSWFDNDTTSYKANAPTNSSATFHFYKGYNCSETSIGSEYQTRSVAAGVTDALSDIDDLPDNWNDKLTSVKVTYTYVEPVTEVVSASGVVVSISGKTASSSYSFTSNIDSDESGSTYVWYRANDASGAGSVALGNTGKTYALDDADDKKFLKVCVTPSSGTATGSQVCSGWAGVGRLLKLYQHTGYGGTNVNVAYEQSPRETCFNLTDLSFNDAMSSFQWTNNSVAAATVWFYQHTNCTSTVTTQTIPIANSSQSVSNVITSMGSSWNDAVSSFKVSWSPTVSISNVQLTLLGSRVTQTHTFNDSTGLPEASTYSWYRASDASGTGATLISDGSDYSLSIDDNTKYLKLCILGSNGLNVASAPVCSGYIPVGHLATLYSSAGQTGTYVSLAYETAPPGTCFSLTHESFDRLMTSAAFRAPSSVPLGYSLFQNADCLGPPSGTGSVAPGQMSLKEYAGTSNNNRVSSLKFNF